MKTLFKVILATTIGVLMPILIWIALGVAIFHKTRKPTTITSLKARLDN